MMLMFKYVARFDCDRAMSLPKRRTTHATFFLHRWMRQFLQLSLRWEVNDRGWRTDEYLYIINAT